MTKTPDTPVPGSTPSGLTIVKPSRRRRLHAALVAAFAVAGALLAVSGAVALAAPAAPAAPAETMTDAEIAGTEGTAAAAAGSTAAPEGVELGAASPCVFNIQVKLPDAAVWSDTSEDGVTPDHDNEADSLESPLTLAALPSDDPNLAEFTFDVRNDPISTEPALLTLRIVELTDAPIHQTYRDDLDIDVFVDGVAVTETHPLSNLLEDDVVLDSGVMPGEAHTVLIRATLTAEYPGEQIQFLTAIVGQSESPDSGRGDLPFTGAAVTAALARLAAGALLIGLAALLGWLLLLRGQRRDEE